MTLTISSLRHKHDPGLYFCRVSVYSEDNATQSRLVDSVVYDLTVACQFTLRAIISYIRFRDL